MSRLIDLSQIPAPKVVETLDFEVLLAELKADFEARWPTFTADLESEPIIKLLEVAAYRELLLRARINDAAQAGMLTHARDSDLDNLAARYNVARHPGETDAAFRRRVQIGFHQVAAAGSADLYRFHVLDANPAIIACDAWSPSAGVVTISPLAKALVDAKNATEQEAAIGTALFGRPINQTGKIYRVATPDDAPFVAARERLATVQPLGIDLRYAPPITIAYRIEATLIVPHGPDPARILADATDRITQQVQQLAAFRVDIHRPALHAALMADGARTVQLTDPATDLSINFGSLAVCTGINLKTEVRDD